MTFLPREFYAVDAVPLARALIGRVLVRVLPNGTRLAARIVETEAYLGVRDCASHAFGGRRTPRNESMYARPGTAYVYFTYGMHFCFNVVCGEIGHPAAVLIRAAEPTEGLPEMSRRRAGITNPTGLCSGPAKLCQAMGIDRSLDGVDLSRAESLFIEPGDPVPASRLSRTPRIGVAYAGDWANRPLRWHERRCPFVTPGFKGKSARGR